MSLEISIIIPSLRPKVLKECIHRIYQTTKDIEYEIIVVSPFKFHNIRKMDRIRLVREKCKGGSNRAIELGVQYTKGEYLFMLSDDQLLDTNCLKNLVEFMRTYGNKLFLGGVRYHDFWEVHPENTVYGFYYPKNPCIKKSNLKKVGKFYDDNFNSYFSDPDLALRILVNGGTSTICPTAWIEQCNVVRDEVTLERRKRYFESDSKKFLARWKPIYGHLVSNPDRPEVVNLGQIFLFKDNEIPCEKNIRMYYYIRKKDWTNLENEIKNDYISSKFFLPILFGYCCVFFYTIPQHIRRQLFIDMLKRLFEMYHRLDFKDTFYILNFGHKSTPKHIEKRMLIDRNIVKSKSSGYKEKKLKIAEDIIEQINNKKVSIDNLYSQINTKCKVN